jgi:hypothetical protein
MQAKPRKPWRVILDGHDETEHTSEAKAFEHVRTALRSGSDTAKVMQWADGRWWHFETMHAEEVSP